jgi:hypothetical protein
MSKFCLQLKQNLETIKTLKSELDLELPKIEKLFKDLKNGDPSTSLRAERKYLMNKIKSLKSKINSEINKIEDELPTKKIEVGQEFNLKFEYRKLEEMIRVGSFDWKNSDINSINFPDLQEKELLNKVIKLKAKIFDFKKTISNEDVFKELDKEGYRSATLTELLALAEIDPELQRQFTIVSFGSVWRSSNGRRRVPCLDVNGSERRLYLDWFDDDWSAHCRFLAVRKSR